MGTRSRKRRLASTSECAMAVVDSEEKHERAACAFAANENDDPVRSGFSPYSDPGTTTSSPSMAPGEE
jgi:hypothetical protein